MARTQKEIKQIIINSYVSERSIAGLAYDNPDNWSITSIKRLLVNVVTFCWWLVEQVLDIHTKEVDTKLRELKAPTLRWMRNKALEFQYGSSLVQDQDFYDNTGLTDLQIAQQKIIAQSAAVKEDGVVKIKVVKNVGGEFEKLSAPEKAAFENFGNEVLPPVPVQYISTDADKIVSEYDVYYNPQVLRADGTSILLGTKPVEDAFKAYLKQLQFNGRFIKEKMEDVVQNVNGVVTIKEKYVRAAAFTNPSLSTVNVFYQPFSGFLKYYNPATDLIINYIAWQD